MELVVPMLALLVTWSQKVDKSSTSLGALGLPAESMHAAWEQWGQDEVSVWTVGRCDCCKILPLCDIALH